MVNVYYKVHFLPNQNLFVLLHNALNNIYIKQFLKVSFFIYQ